MNDCYLTVINDEVVLLCRRKECRIDAPFGYAWYEYIPSGSLPEYAVIRRAKHLATHHD